MPKSRLTKRLMLSWVRAPRVTGGQEMTNGRSLERHLKRFGLPLVYTKPPPHSIAFRRKQLEATYPPF